MRIARWIRGGPLFGNDDGLTRCVGCSRRLDTVDDEWCSTCRWEIEQENLRRLAADDEE